MAYQGRWQNSGVDYLNEQSNNVNDLINILSFVIGMENLQENRQQSAHNDVQIANDKQAQYLLEEINKKFEEQNKILDKLVELLEKW